MPIKANVTRAYGDIFFFLLLRFFFDVDFLSFIGFVTILLLFYVLLFWPRGMWGLSSPTRDWTHTPALVGEVLTSRLPGSPYSTLKILPSDFFCKFSFYINTEVFHNQLESCFFFFKKVENFQEGRRKKVLFPEQQSDSLYILCHVAVAGWGFCTGRMGKCIV